MKNCKSCNYKLARIVYTRSKNDEILHKYLKRVEQIPQLSIEEEKVLAKLAKSGNISAKRKLINANLYLAANIAGKIQHPSMSYSDLLQEANLGLMIAADKFNYKLGYRFATYASWWIKQTVLKSISEQSNCIKVPVYVQEIVSKYSKMNSKIENSINENKKFEMISKKMNINPEKLREYINAFNSNVSLDEPIDSDGSKDLKLIDMLADENSNATLLAEMKEIKENIDNAISNLNEKEQRVIIFRYGLNGKDKKTLNEIGDIFGVTKECIRQTEIRALKHLKDICSKTDKNLCLS